MQKACASYHVYGNVSDKSASRFNKQKQFSAPLGFFGAVSKLQR